MECQGLFRLLFELCFVSGFMLSAVAAGGSVGINYGRVANNLPSAVKVVTLLKKQGIDKVKIYDSDPAVLQALSGSGISVVIGLPNEQLFATARRQSAAEEWVSKNVAKYLPNTKITTIAVGNEVFVDPHNTTRYLITAMQNVHSALVMYKIDDKVKVSSPIALSALQTSYPSSAGVFKQDLAEVVMKPMLEFLRQTGSYLMVNAYPFFAYKDNADVISLDYALFKPNAGVVDSGSGLQYTNLLDAQLDAVNAAMAALKYGDVRTVVTETGWPSKGDENETGASLANAAAYNSNLVRRVLSGKGTPLRPQTPLEVYLFALFNENKKNGPTSERNYGLFFPDEEKVYNVPLLMAKSGDDHKGSSPPVDVGSAAGGQSWCVASEEASEDQLQAALDYACGEGGADCKEIQPGASCYDPDTLKAHASFAFNSYYQKNARTTGTCDFHGAAYVVSQLPKFGKCALPTGF
ncbi:hypothetical protein AMTR_s00112p00108890 [Amborella trichopoda]|uniref:glucan endo-1,3-beta-D-glucosidase n=2 Tax=Amborella trichopoda TaxID=13333 RepID=W1NXW9_AMBTC|nr:hypothetical protein AMTR_s00112p00108890 [Amborella trichopoda]